MHPIDFSTCDILNEDTGLYSIDENGLAVTTATGSMYRKGNTCSNLFLCPGSFTEAAAEVQVSLMPQANGEQAGLVLFRDWDNYIKLVREKVADRDVVIFMKELDGVPEIIMNIPYEPDVIGLGITVTAGKIGISIKAPAAAKQKIPHFFNWLGAGRELRIGLLVHGNNPGNKAVFSSFKADRV